MTSKDEQIQYLYNKIKTLIPWDWSNCECKYASCDNCSILINNLQQENRLFRKSEMEDFIQIILGIHKNQTFIGNHLKFNDPFSKVSEPHNIVWSSLDYQIVFIGCGIRLIMNEKMIKKIGILDSILNKENGYDKPLQINYLYNGLYIMNGPKLYITKLSLDSLLFNIPPDDYNNRLFHGGYDGEVVRQYFKYNNIEEAIINKIYY